MSEPFSFFFDQSFMHGSHSSSLFFAFLAGVLTSLSPCVYPLIPITLSIMGTRSYQNHWHGFSIALCYVLGMSLIYSFLGVLFAYLGLMAGSLMQHPLILLIIAAFFCLMAVSMFGAFELMLPSPLLSYLSKVGGPGYGGAFFMGAVAGLIAAPCTGPVLSFILALIAEGQDVGLGFSLMLSFSLGLGLLFLILGTFSASLSYLPKSGPWMNKIKYIFGTLILASAFYYMSLAIKPIKSLFLFLASFGLSMLIIASVLGFLLVLSKQVMRIAGVILASLGIASFLSMQGLNIKNAPSEQTDIVWHVISADNKDQAKLADLFEQAKKRSQPILIDFYADWCVACKELDSISYADQAVKKALFDFMTIKVDLSKSSDELQAIENRFAIKGLPTVIFIDRLGEELVKKRIIGFVRPHELLQTILSIIK